MRALPIWNAFGHQRAVIICDPENTHQRQFTGDFKDKPRRARLNQVCKHIKGLHESVPGEKRYGKGEEGTWGKQAGLKKVFGSPFCWMAHSLYETLGPSG